MKVYSRKTDNERAAKTIISSLVQSCVGFAVECIVTRNTCVWEITVRLENKRHLNNAFLGAGCRNTDQHIHKGEAQEDDEFGLVA